MPLVVLLVLLSFSFLFGQDVVDAIVAIVNDDIITISDYMIEHDTLYELLRSQFQGEEFTKQYKKEKEGLLERMITEQLLLQEATRQDIRSTANIDEQIRTLVDNIKAQYNIGSDEEFKRMMAKQGINYESWIEQQERNILQQALIFSEVGRSIAIDETDVVNYYDLHPEEFTELPSYKLRGIYISSEDKSDEDAQAKMEEIDRKIAAGEELEGLASEYSEGPEKESKGDKQQVRIRDYLEDLKKRSYINILIPDPFNYR